MNFTPQACILALALAAATVPVKSDDCSQLEYCGGAQGDLGAEISCTPFPVKSTKLPPYQWATYCDNEDVPKYAGSNKGAKTWQYKGNDPKPNYWVFHGKYLHRNGNFYFDLSHVRIVANNEIASSFQLQL